MKLLIIVTFFALFPYINCVDCYDCQNCEIPFNNQTSTSSCSSGVTQCLKITAKLGTVYTYVNKQCGPCGNFSFLYGVTYLKVDCCTGTLCNGNIRLVFCEYLVLAFVFISFLFCK